MIRLQRKPLNAELRARITEREARLMDLLGRGVQIPDSLADSYRDPDLKEHLRAETNGKCAYCESKISHVYFGDVEHIVPKALRKDLSLSPRNLTFACAKCNNNKRDYWDAELNLIDPFMDDPAEEFHALGCGLFRKAGRMRAQLTIEIIDLNRIELFERRRERIELLQSLADQYAQTPEGPIRQLIRAELRRQVSDNQEYAFFVRAYLNAVCGSEWNTK